MKRKICVVITARASYSRVKTALSVINQHPLLALQLVLSGSAMLDKYGSVVDQIVADGLEILASFSNVLESSSPADSVKTVALSMIELSTFFKQNKPDLVVTIADRYETVATAAAAALMNIPLVHIQGGETTGNIDNKVRNAVTQFADYHFVATEKAQKRVIELGANVKQVFNTGCPSIDIALDILKNNDQNFDPFTLYEAIRIDLSKGYVVVMQHPVTTEYPYACQQVQETLIAIEALQLPALWFLPNPDLGTDGVSNVLRTYQEQNPDSLIQFFKSMKTDHFLKLIKNSLCLIGNSSVGIRECASLGIPVVNIGSRQSGRERADNVRDVPYHSGSILNAIQEQIKHGHYPPTSIYGNGKSGARIAEILSSIALPSIKHDF